MTMFRKLTKNQYNLIVGRRVLQININLRVLFTEYTHVKAI